MRNGAVISTVPKSLPIQKKERIKDITVATGFFSRSQILGSLTSINIRVPYRRRTVTTGVYSLTVQNNHSSTHRRTTVTTGVYRRTVLVRVYHSITHPSEDDRHDGFIPPYCTKLSIVHPPEDDRHDGCIPLYCTKLSIVHPPSRRVLTAVLHEYIIRPPTGGRPSRRVYTAVLYETIILPPTGGTPSRRVEPPHYTCMR